MVRTVVFVPIFIVAIIIGLAATDSLPSEENIEALLPSDVKLESILPSEETDSSSNLKVETDLSDIEKPVFEEIRLGTIKIDGVLFEVELADTKDLRSKGLAFHEELPFDRGMLFVYDSPDRQTLWMLHMRFPLDIIWMDGDGKIVHIEKNLQPCKTTCPTHKNKERNALYVLEVNAGFLDKHKITKRSIVEIISI